jgi:hypothetical protein
MFNFIDISIFITASGCVCRVPSALLCLGHIMLLRWPCLLPWVHMICPMNTGL